MGCDIHLAIQVQDYGVWVHVPYQTALYDHQIEAGETPVPDLPIAPKYFRSRNYDLFGILADVRNGSGFAGIQTGEGWPSIAQGRGFPADFDSESVPEEPRYRNRPDDTRYMGDHSFTWVSLEELEAFPWDTMESWLYGVVCADQYDMLSATGKTPTNYSGDISSPGIKTYEPDEYKRRKLLGTLAPRPHVRMGWPETTRQATNDWPGEVLPWLRELAAGRPLRLVMGFDS